LDGMVSHLSSLSNDRLILSFAPKTWYYTALKRIGELFPGKSKTTRAYLHSEEVVEDALKKAAQAEMDAQDAKRRGKKDLKKQASTLKELQRALAKEKQAREGLDKALEALLSGGLSAPGAEKATANAREIRTEAAKLLSASDENGLREVLTERAELQAQARELRASLIKANQKVQFLEENGQLIAGDLAHLKDVTDQNRDLKSKNEELTDQISDLEQEILILSEDQKEKTKMLTDYIQAPADGPRRERRRRGSNDSTSSIQSREDVQSTFDRIREA